MGWKEGRRGPAVFDEEPQAKKSSFDALWDKPEDTNIHDAEIEKWLQGDIPQIASEIPKSTDRLTPAMSGPPALPREAMPNIADPQTLLLQQQSQKAKQTFQEGTKHLYT